MPKNSQLTVREAFSEAVLHDRHVLLGREMQPFCIDHWLILDALSSPLIHGGKIGIVDLQLAIKACSTSTIAEFYAASLRPTFGWRMWALITRNYPVAPVLSAFNDYIDDYWPKFPRIYFGDEVDELKCPSAFVSAARLVDSGHDPVKVRRMGMGEMDAWCLALGESRGDPLKGIKSDAVVTIERELATEEAAHG